MPVEHPSFHPSKYSGEPVSGGLGKPQTLKLGLSEKENLSEKEEQEVRSKVAVIKKTI